MTEFSGLERRNLVFYIIGIMLYKFCLETMNACINGIVLNRSITNAGQSWANMQGLNLASQCFGSMLIGPLVKQYRPKRVLSLSILCFGLVLLIIPILEFVTGGTIPKLEGSKFKSSWGSFSPLIFYLILPVTGIFHGMVELMRRVFPSVLVGGDCEKLKRMDSIVHIGYEITGTMGSFLAFYWINYFGWGYSLLLLPIGFFMAFLSWNMIQDVNQEIKDDDKGITKVKESKIEVCKKGFYSFFHSLSVGAKLVCTQRALVWLIPAYTLPLVVHRYLENTLFPFYSKSLLGSSDYQTILTGGSNFGELLGAALVLILAKRVKTPIPFLRLDVVFLLFIWIIPFFPINSENPMVTAWQLAPIMTIISSGWAAGDVTLSAYVQSRLYDYANIDEFTSPLGAVMSFLYVIYLVCFYFLNLTMSIIRDDYVKNNKNLVELFVLIGGVFLTICGFITFISTFIPRGSFSINPDPDLVVFDQEIFMEQNDDDKASSSNQTLN